jgi:hypothetical protein
MMTYSEKQESVQKAVKAMVKGLIAGGGTSFALGYMESFLYGQIMEQVVDETELHKLCIQMYGIGCDYMLDSKDVAA